MESFRKQTGTTGGEIRHTEIRANAGATAEATQIGGEEEEENEE